MYITNSQLGMTSVPQLQWSSLASFLKKTQDLSVFYDLFLPSVVFIHQCSLPTFIMDCIQMKIPVSWRKLSLVFKLQVLLFSISIFVIVNQCTLSTWSATAELLFFMYVETDLMCLRYNYHISLFHSILYCLQYHSFTSALNCFSCLNKLDTAVNLL